MTCNMIVGSVVGLDFNDPDPDGGFASAEVLCRKPATYTQGPNGFSLCDEHMSEWAEAGDEIASFERIT